MTTNNLIITPFDRLFQVQEVGGKSSITINDVLAQAAEEQLTPASEDTDRNLLLVIDQQNSFIEGGDLGVPGSVQDTVRLGEFMYQNLHKITQIALTKDVHTPLQIFHPCWWKDRDGQHPKPVVTVITVESVISGEWTPVFSPKESLAYLHELKRGGKRELRIWPYHCLEGTSGVEFESQFMNLVYFHTGARRSTPVILAKGQDPLSEMYGAFYREDGVASEANRAFLDGMLAYSNIYIAGQALSHCVLDTLKHILEHHAANRTFTSSIHLLTDCSSPIPGTEQLTEAAIKELVNQYGIQLVEAEGLNI
jgi:nicotinamidase-related amidase